MAVAFSRRQRASPLGAVASVSLAAPPEAPARVTVTNTADSIVVSWDDSSSATAYNVYRDEPAEGAPPAADDPLWSATVPAPLTRAPVPERTFSEAVEFGRRALLPRAGGALGAARRVEGSRPSRACHDSAGHVPAGGANRALGVASDGGITLKWAPNAENDLAGYLILRGRPGDATLLPITDAPVTQTQFLDRNVMSGVRYVYAVVAVDRARHANRSPESERDEATAP